ncbi:unnamed protein product [Prorocentrum cordatum]|uniref:Uncharacterized protein n=1 Tax=Prorocentrum cordatum TaxID=2364126 RepID=A0ABN9TNZ6_9DINO|nr:unnamed protein product [Polarella glacialis]
MAPSLGSLHTLCAIVLIPRPPPMARGAAVAANAQRRAMRSLLQHNSTRMNFQSLFVDAARITKQLLESPVDPLNKWKRTPALAVNSAGFDFDAEDMPRGPSGRRRRKRREEEEEEEEPGRHGRPRAPVPARAASERLRPTTRDSRRCRWYDVGPTWSLSGHGGPRPRLACPTQIQRNGPKTSAPPEPEVVLLV